MSVSPAVTVSRRNLPHWHRAGAVYWVTFRLADSLPQDKLTCLRAEKEAWLLEYPEPWAVEVEREYQARFGERVQQWLDAGYGSCALARPHIRSVVRGCLTRFDGVRFDLHAAVIMPNHVHALIEPLDGQAEAQGGRQTGMSVSRREVDEQTGMSVSQLSGILKGIKGASARAANRLLGQRGTFWMDESYDRIVRDREEYGRFIHYIEENPRKAELREGEYWLYIAPAVAQAFLPVDAERAPGGTGGGSD